MTNSGARTEYALPSGSPASANYAVEVDFVPKTVTTDQRPHIVIRASSTAETHVSLGFNGSTWELARRLSGSAAALGNSSSVTLVAGTTYKLRLHAVDNTYVAYLNGAELLRADYTGITDAGKAGLRFRTISGADPATATTGSHLDNFLAEDINLITAQASSSSNASGTLGSAVEDDLVASATSTSASASTLSPAPAQDDLAVSVISTSNATATFYPPFEDPLFTGGQGNVVYIIDADVAETWPTDGSGTLYYRGEATGPIRSFNSEGKTWTGGSTPPSVEVLGPDSNTVGHISWTGAGTGGPPVGVVGTLGKTSNIRIQRKDGLPDTDGDPPLVQRAVLATSVVSVSNSSGTLTAPSAAAGDLAAQASSSSNATATLTVVVDDDLAATTVSASDATGRLDEVPPRRADLISTAIASSTAGGQFSPAPALADLATNTASASNAKSTFGLDLFGRSTSSTTAEATFFALLAPSTSTASGELSPAPALADLAGSVASTSDASAYFLQAKAISTSNATGRLSTPPKEVIYDTFTDSDKFLIDHVGEAGASWSHPTYNSSGTRTQILGNTVTLVTTKTRREYVLASGELGGDDYSTQVDVIMKSQTGEAQSTGPVARVSTTERTMVGFAYSSGSNTWTLFEEVAGALTILQSVPVASLSSARLRLVVVGPTAIGFVDDVEVARADTRVLTGNRAGLRFFFSTTIAGTAETGLHVDNFVADNISRVTSAPVSRSNSSATLTTVPLQDDLIGSAIARSQAIADLLVQGLVSRAASLTDATAIVNIAPGKSKTIKLPAPGTQVALAQISKRVTMARAETQIKLG